MVEDRAQEGGLGIIGRAAGEQHGAGSSELDRPGDLAVGPGVDPVPDGLAMSGKCGDRCRFGGDPIRSAE